MCGNTFYSFICALFNRIVVLKQSHHHYQHRARRYHGISNKIWTPLGTVLVASTSITSNTNESGTSITNKSSINNADHQAKASLATP